MAGGCWVCNPFCGKCQPAPKKSARCPECGMCTIFDRLDIIAGTDLLCRKCGADLSSFARPEPVLCSFSGLACAYPCGKSASTHTEGSYRICKRNTPLQD